MMDGYRKPVSSLMKAVRLLIEHYQVYFVCPALSSDVAEYATAQGWLTEHVGVPAWGHTIFCNQRGLLYGDYLITALPCQDSMATVISYGSDTFKTWEEIITYFERLGGQ